jgi:hypothetical protein
MEGDANEGSVPLIGREGTTPLGLFLSGIFGDASEVSVERGTGGIPVFMFVCVNAEDGFGFEGTEEGFESMGGTGGANA